MLFKPKQKKKIRCVILSSDTAELYNGPLSEIPLCESLILETSTRFFNDPNPCYIHRGAVRVRLTAELEALFVSCDQSQLCAKFESYTGLEGICHVQLEER